MWQWPRFEDLLVGCALNMTLVLFGEFATYRFVSQIIVKVLSFTCGRVGHDTGLAFSLAKLCCTS